MWNKLVQNKKRIFAAILTITLLSVSFCPIEAKTKIKSKAVTLNAAEVTLYVGNIATLTAIMQPVNSTDTLRWSSSDESVAEVNKYGVVTAKKEGAATITVKTSSKKTASCEVTVKKVLSDAEIQQMIEDNTLSKEEILQLIREEHETESDKPEQNSVTLMKGQTLPMLINDPGKTGIVGNITTLTVTKRPMTSNFILNNEFHYLPYRYDVILISNVSVVKDAQKASYQVDINFGAPNAGAKIDQSKEILSTSFSGNTFTEVIAFYSAYSVEEFFIESVKWVSK